MRARDAVAIERDAIVAWLTTSEGRDAWLGGPRYLADRIRRGIPTTPVLASSLPLEVIRHEDGLGPLARAAQRRPSNFDRLLPEEQWAIDRQLGVLDWDGDPSK